MFQAPFSFEGRIRRSEFCISFIISVFARVIAAAIASAADEDAANIIILLFSIPVIWFQVAQGAKRCHDLGNSGWWQLIPFYALWMLFQDGQPGYNEYGKNPKDLNQTPPLPNNPQSTQTTANAGGYSGGYNGGHNNHGSQQPYQNTTPNNGEYKSGDLYR